MTITIPLVLLVLALVAFIIATVSSWAAKFPGCDMFGLGLALWVSSIIVRGA